MDSSATQEGGIQIMVTQGTAVMSPLNSTRGDPTGGMSTSTLAPPSAPPQRQSTSLPFAAHPPMRDNSVMSLESEGESSAYTTRRESGVAPPAGAVSFSFGGHGNQQQTRILTSPTGSGDGSAHSRRRSTIMRNPSAPKSQLLNGGSRLSLQRTQSKMFRSSNAPSSRRGSVEGGEGSMNLPSGGGGAKQGGGVSVTQQHPTQLPEEVLDLIQAFRVSVEHVAANPSTPPESSKELHQTSNDLIRYVSGFLIMKHQQELAEAERVSSGWKNAALNAAQNAKLSASAEAMGPMALQALYGCLDSLLNLCQCDRGTLFLLDERTSELVSVVTVGNGQVMKPIRMRTKAGVVGSVFGTGLALNVLSTERVPNTLFDRSTDKQTGYYTRSILATPLIRPHGTSGQTAASKLPQPSPPQGATEAPRKSTGVDASSLFGSPLVGDSVGRGSHVSGVSPSGSPVRLRGTTSESGEKDGGAAGGGFSVRSEFQRFSTFSGDERAGMSVRSGATSASLGNLDGVEGANINTSNQSHAVTIGGSVIGVLELINKAHHMSHGEFDEHDEVIVHHAAKLMTNIIQWTSLADLSGSAALDLSMKIQADIITHREHPEGIRTNSTAGNKRVTITEAEHLFKKQKEKEQKLEKITMAKDLLSGRKGNKNLVLTEGGDGKITATSGGGASIEPPSSVIHLGRRVDLGSTLVYRVGGRPGRGSVPPSSPTATSPVVPPGASSSAFSLPGTSTAPHTAPVQIHSSTSSNGPQRDVRDVMLFLQQMEGSWKAAREKCQKQEEVIKQLRLHLFEERKRFRVLHNLCVKTGLISDSDYATCEDNLLLPDEAVDDLEFLHRLNVNEERIRAQQSMVSKQDAFLHFEREKTASHEVRKTNTEAAAERRARELASLRDVPYDHVSKAREKLFDRELSQKSGGVMAKDAAGSQAKRVANERKMVLEKKRKTAVKSKLNALVKRHEDEREIMMERQRQETEDLYKEILVEDTQFDEALSKFLEDPSKKNPTPKVTYQSLVDELTTAEETWDRARETRTSTSSPTQPISRRDVSPGLPHQDGAIL